MMAEDLEEALTDATGSWGPNHRRCRRLRRGVCIATGVAAVGVVAFAAGTQIDRALLPHPGQERVRKRMEEWHARWTPPNRSAGDEPRCISPWDQQEVQALQPEVGRPQADQRSVATGAVGVLREFFESAPEAFLGDLGKSLPPDAAEDVGDEKCHTYPNVVDGFCSFQNHQVVASFGQLEVAERQDQEAKAAYGRICDDTNGQKLLGGESAPAIPVCAVALSMALCTQAMPPCNPGGFVERCEDTCLLARMCATEAGVQQLPSASQCTQACAVESASSWVKDAILIGLLVCVAVLLCLICFMCLGEVVVMAIYRVTQGREEEPVEPRPAIVTDARHLSPHASERVTPSGSRSGSERGTPTPKGRQAGSGPERVSRGGGTSSSSERRS